MTERPPAPGPEMALTLTLAVLIAQLRALPRFELVRLTDDVTPADQVVLWTDIEALIGSTP